MDETEHVQFSSAGGAGIVTLRNERALNALTLPMIGPIHAQLVAWSADDMISCIVIEGTGDRAFCAGGDVRAMAQAGRAGDRRLTRRFFREEYRLNRAIGVLTKPYVALMDGVTMGGGVGLSAHGALQIATERTLWAMPETAIGFFPDVGASHVLNRLDPPVAAFLALTGWRLRAGDLLALGLATHFVPSNRLAALKEALADGADAPRGVADCFAEIAPEPDLRTHLDVIRACFAQSSVEAIRDALVDDASAFAIEVVGLIGRMSPTSCKVALEQLSRTRGLDLDRCLMLEFRMSQHFIAGHDFYEGVRALLIDKDQRPNWRPSNLAAVCEADVASYFAPLTEGDLQFGEMKP